MLTILASVWDKTGLTEFLTELKKQEELNIIATSSTAKYIAQAGFKVTEVAEVTEFPEILDGRVKTLHPKIMGGILARGTEAHLATLTEHQIPKIDLVIVNLYPFKEMQEKQLPLNELIEYIDIGGVSLLRAAAKNYERVSVISNNSQFSQYLNAVTIEEKNRLRQQFAQQAFAHTASYDQLIASSLMDTNIVGSLLPDSINIQLQKIETLRYGENPQNQAAWYGPNSQWPFECLQGKALSYNNLMDIAAAVNLLAEFDLSQPACCIMKHVNPCGVALANTALEAYQKAFNADSTSAFGGIIGFNTPIDAETAKAITQQFAEIVIAPEFTSEAIELFKTKKNLRLVVVAKNYYQAPQLQMLREITPFGYLLEKSENAQEVFPALNWVSQQPENDLTPALLSDCQFAWKVVKHLRSNAIVVVKNGVTLGVGVGQTSRISATEQALAQAGDEAKGAVVASDGFFPATDNIESLAKAGIKVVIQPGGSLKDADVIEAAQANQLSMAFTGERCFKH